MNNEIDRSRFIVGNDPFPHLPLLNSGEEDTTPIVAEHNFQPEHFDSKYFQDGGVLGSNYGLVGGYSCYDNDIYWGPILERFQRYLNHQGKGRVLDIGCAAGYLARRFVNAGYKEVFGIDISPDILEQASRNVPNARFERFNLNTDCFNPELFGTFDGITAADVIEHTAHRFTGGRRISGPEHVIPKIVPLLRPGGIFIMSVPVDDPNPISRMFNKIDTDRSHVSKLPTSESIRILQASGLEILEQNHAFLTPWWRVPFLPTALEVVCRKR